MADRLAFKQTHFIAYGFTLGILCLLLTNTSEGQESTHRLNPLDSLLQLHAASSGKERVELDIELTKTYMRSDNYNEAFEFANDAKDLAEHSNDSKLKALAYHILGRCHYRWDQSTESIRFMQKALLLRDALPANLELDCYVVLGVNHFVHGGDEDAIAYYRKAIPLQAEAESLTGRKYNFIYNNMAIAYANHQEYDSAWKYHQLCLKERLTDSNYNSLGQTYNNLGTLFYEQSKFDSSLYYFEKGLKFRSKHEPPVWSAIYESKINIGKAALALRDYRRAMQILTASFDSAESKNHLPLQLRAAEQLKTLHAEMGHYQEAYQFNDIFHSLQDTLFGLEKKEEIIRLKMANKYEEKVLQDSLARLEERKIAALEDEQERQTNFLILLSLIGAIVLLLGIVILIYFNLRARKKSAQIILAQKKEVEEQREIALHQKDLLAERNKEITDSITYAERIQKAILPSTAAFKKKFPSAFVFYKPKDIVAGDFYWLEYNDQTSETFFAVADCTGHGVPGAMVSVVCHNALNRSVREFKLSSPADILNKTRELVIETLSQSGDEVKDGMDISLIHIQDRTLHFAGANNPLWLVRGTELIEIKGDKQPIGLYADATTFTEHTIEIVPGDQAYLFSDGYQDQFGGPKGKKFKTGNLKKLILDVSVKPMTEQKTILSETLKQWCGDMEQVDDVCIAGIKF